MIRYVSRHVVLDPQTWQLRVGEDVLSPEPKVFELLAYLMRNPGRVVPRAELLDSLWSGEVVGESVLTRCISCIRKLLADDARMPKFIRTAHARGYEFIAPVSAKTVPVPAASDAARPLTSPNSEPSIDVFQSRFVGRAAEAYRLRVLMAESASQRIFQFALVTGEAGIGKTRLLAEVTRMAPNGVAAHWARAANLEGAPPFFVWRQWLRSIVTERSLKTVHRAFRDKAGDAQRLLLSTDQWQMHHRLGWDSPSHRFRTFDAIAEALAELARQRPLVLVLDDLHGADLASLLLLEFVLDRIEAPVVLLGAMRATGMAVSSERDRILSTIRGKSRAELNLEGLSRAEVSELIGATVREPRPGFADEVHSRTGGNPFFVSVLVSNVGQERLPEAVRQAVFGRLSSLPLDCVCLLELAAVYSGFEFDSRLLARAANIPIAECIRLLRIACDERLVASSSPDRFHFVHDLVRELLYDEIETDRRARMHLAVGGVLERLSEYQTANQAAVLAYHFFQGADQGGASRALDLSIRAGAYALRNFAYEDAIHQFTRATRFLGTLADADSATEFAVLLDLGLAQVSAGLREAGQQTLHLAALKAREQGSAADLASVALGLAPGLFAIETGVFDAGLVALLREAIEQLGSGDDRLRALLLARLGLALYWSNTFEERVAICREVDALAERVGTDEVRAAAMTARAFALLRPSSLEERRYLSQQAIELCQRAGDHQSLLLNRLLLGAVLLEGGDQAAAAFEADAFSRLAEETRQPQSLWIVQAHRASQLLLQGRLDEVERLAADCFMTGQRIRDHNALLTFGVHLSLVRIEQARAAEVLDVIRDYAARYPLIVGWRVLHAYALGRAGQSSASATEYESLRDRGFALPDDLNWLVSTAWLVETCHALGDGRGAALLYQRLLPFADRLVVIGYAGIGCLGSVCRYLGLLSCVQGDLATAIHHFERAARANRHFGGELPLAYTLHDWALALLSDAAKVSNEDRTTAASHLDEAEAFARDRNLPALLGLIQTTRQRFFAPAAKS